MSDQNSEAVNAGKSGGNNMQGQNISVDRTQCGTINTGPHMTHKGTSNGGK